MRANAQTSKGVRERLGRLTGAAQETRSEPTGPSRVPTGPHRESTHSPPSAVRARLARIFGPPHASAERIAAERVRSPAKALELVAPGLLFGTPHGATYVARRCPNRWPGQGKWAPEHLAERCGGALALMCGAAPVPERRLDDPRRWLFLDTESIGLGGWGGNMAFVIGLGYFAKRGFRVEQIVVRSFEEEAAALWHLTKVAERFDALVTFNGKSFDLPLLRHRCRFLGVDPGALDKAQLDLLGVSRSVFRERLLDCKLATLEEEILGLQRKQDVASADIPAIFFDYLHGGCSEGMARVLRHNEQDLLSMVFLAGALLDAAEGRLSHSKWCGITPGDHRRAALAQAKAHVRRALDAERGGAALRAAVAGAEAALRWAQIGDAPVDVRLRAARRVGRIRRKVLRAERATS